MRLLVDNPVRRYAWGSVDAIPLLLGTESDGRPQAEVWFGAHERGSSQVAVDGGTMALLDLVGGDPEHELGPAWAAAGRMPFLAKVVAPAEPLSLQVHPDAEWTARWFADEERRGVDRDASSRSCPDAVAKAEMVWAVTPFHALCGFRPTDDAVEWLDALDVAGLKPTTEALRLRGRSALRQEVERLLRMPAPGDTVTAVRASAGVLRQQARWATSAGTASELAERYPDDPAVLLALLLQPVTLAPGDAMFVRPGRPHTYLRGTAFEVQANSDNVLRAGLSHKHVELDLLPDALDTASAGVTPITGESEGCEQVFAPDTDRFALSVVHDTGALGCDLRAVPGPQVFLCVEGDFTLRAADERLLLGRGAAAYVSARTTQLRVEGRGTLLRVTTGRGNEYGKATR